MPTTLTSDSTTTRRVDHEEFIRGRAPNSSNNTEQSADSSKRSSPPRKRAGTTSSSVSSYPRTFSGSNTLPPRDTSVQVANAFKQAALSDTMSLPNQHSFSRNNAGSSSGTLNTNFGSTSTLVGTSSSSLKPPSMNYGRAPNSRGSSTSGAHLKPPSLTSNGSYHGAEGEDDDDGDMALQRSRALSPMEEISAKHRHTSPFLVALRDAGKAPFQPLPTVVEGASAPPESEASGSIDESLQLHSMDRERLQADFENMTQQAKATAQRRARKPVDSSYRPPKDEVESSDDYSSDDGRKRRKKKREIPGQARMDRLPTVAEGSTKRRKSTRGGRRSTTSSQKPASSAANGQDEDMSSTGYETPRVMSPEISIEPPPEESEEEFIANSMGADELEYEFPPPTAEELAYHEQIASPPSRNLSIPHLIGVGVRQTVRLISLLVRLLQAIVQGIYDVTLRPIATWVSGATGGNLGKLGASATLLLLLAALYAATPFTSTPTHTSPTPQYPQPHPYPSNRGGFLSSIFGRPSTPGPFQPPAELPENFDEFIAQLSAMQTELARLSTHASDEAAQRRAIQFELEVVRRRAEKAEAEHQRLLDTMSNDVSGLKRRVDNPPPQPPSVAPSEVKEKFAKMEKHITHVQDWVRRVESAAEHALPSQIRELEKKVAALPSSLSAARSTVTNEVKIRTGKGEDVTPALAEYFQKMIVASSKDRIGRADYAIYTGGGRIIPSLTSPTFGVDNKSSWLPSFKFSPTPKQGRPPVTAIVPDINVGSCWPFAGSEGTLGVYLARHINVEAITIDHAPKELAYDLAPAPRKVRVWGVVDGDDNIAKYEAYAKDLRERWGTHKLKDDDEKEEAEWIHSDVPPTSVSASLATTNYTLIRLAGFEYDISGKDNVQTFDVSPRIRALGIDVGLVLVDIQSNWGHKDYTCLYRVRVHGTRPPSATSDGIEGPPPAPGVDADAAKVDATL